MFQSLTSRYNTLRSNLLSSEADGDTEDDTHICRVLRAYYTEKGRPFPPWLPPDPKAPQPLPQTQFVTSSGRQPGQQPSNRGKGLSDLWGESSQQAPQQEPASLRRGAQGRGGGRLQTRTGIVDSYNNQEQPQSRPLPSQKAGSYQSQITRDRSPVESPQATSGSGGTAQERLRARLWGSGRSNSPVATSPVGSLGSPDARSPADRFGGRSPGGASGYSYPDDRSGYGGGDGGRRGAAIPQVSANAPWTSGGDGYSSGGRDRQSGRERVGLPSGPRPR